jgi:AraC-like DNA-binding protein
MAARRTPPPPVEPEDSFPGLAWASAVSGYQNICPALTWQEVSPPNKFIKALRVELRAPHTDLSLAVSHLRYLPELASQGLLRNLDDLLPPKQREGYFKPLLDLCSYEGKLYFIPEDFSPYVLVSRKDALAQHGFSPPRTWKELQQQARKLSAIHGHPVIGVPTSTPHQILTFILGLIGSNGIPPPSNSDDIIAHQKSYSEAYEWTRSLIGTKPCLDMESLTRRSYGVSGLFNRNKWIYRFCWLQDLKKEQADFFKKVDVQLFPKGPSREKPVILGRGHGWIIPQRSIKLKEGIAGLRLVCSSQHSLKQERRGSYPFHARREIWNDPQVLAQCPVYKMRYLMPEDGRYAIDHANDFLNWFARSFTSALARDESAQKWLSKLPRSIRKDTHNLVAQATSYMEKNLHKAISVEKISQTLTTSRRHLDRLFLQEMQLSVSDYLKNLRMEKAGKLLRSSSLSVKEVARETGFSDHSVFSRTFRRHWGLTPKEIRIQAAQDRVQRK